MVTEETIINDKLKTQTEVVEVKESGNLYDIIILGAGFAGMTCALYAARAEHKVLMLESKIPGGQISTSHLVENYPAVNESISGQDLSDRLTKQVEKFGVKPTFGIVNKINKIDSVFAVSTEGGKIFMGKTVVIATGVDPKELGIPREKEFRGRGVSYCATCDGAFYKDKEVVVIGGGDSAVKEALFLTKYASKVTIIHRRDEFRAEKVISKRAEADPKIKILWKTVVTEIVGENNKIIGVKIKGVNNEEKSIYYADGIFLYVGSIPNTKFLDGFVKLSEDGYIVAGEDTRTSIPALFAAGDVRNKEFRQLVTATADGATAADAADYCISNHCIE